MVGIDTVSKGQIARRLAAGAAKHPSRVRTAAKATRPLARIGWMAGRPVVKHRLRQRLEQAGETAISVARTIVVYGPEVGYQLGWVERPAPKRTAPRVAIGMAIGAGTMYFLEPQHGPEHRAKVAQLMK